jgi:hypothetical protein
MRKLAIWGVLALMVTAIAAVPALAQSGHFVGTPTCRDIGTQLQCSGKVAGLGGTTFDIVASASGTASVTCTNPGGNVAPGQRFTTTSTASLGPTATPRNGQFQFRNLTSATPTAPAGSCPNSMWTATVTDVQFTTATLQLFEDSTLSDSITVPVTT